jgi:hypothetical protein
MFALMSGNCFRNFEPSGEQPLYFGFLFVNDRAIENKPNCVAIVVLIWFGLAGFGGE